ncbi:hypothetical protein AGMMS49587_10480 [Spirochaetia bacterium]|nr:hypothetical protein AGMMS49587_10480 [Spirochaetia bacterium]
MKRAGELLSAFFDEGLIKKAQGYSNLFSAWQKITAKCGIPAAADHSRIRELERCVLLVEADHPGWVQLLQTKQHKLLSDAQRRFPDLTITGISFMLSREPIQGQAAATEQPLAEPATAEPAATEKKEAAAPIPAAAAPAVNEAGGDPLARITDEGLRETLRRLERDLKGK